MQQISQMETSENKGITVLSSKEIDYFKTQLPKGVSIVDFREIKSLPDFVEKNLPESAKDKPYSVQVKKSLENFLKNIKS